MKILFDYFCYRKSIYLLSFLFVFIFCFVSFVYNAFNDAIQYATLICFVILFIYFLYDYYQFYKKNQTLTKMIDLPEVFVSDLSLATDAIEDKYQELLVKMDQIQKTILTTNEQKYQETVNYFTLWVHQIKTPIFALRLLIESQTASKNDLLMQVLKIEQYVEMALHFVKIDAMSSDLKIKHYQLDDLVHDVVKKHATFFIHKKIQLKLDAFYLTILTDEKLISFVIEQILSNALKYTKEGSIHIYLEGEKLYIEDTGIGIKEEDLPRIFERGFTGYNGRMDKKASGLGLYLCKRIIDNLGYKISITSKLGQGTCVCIDFHVNEFQLE